MSGVAEADAPVLLVTGGSSGVGRATAHRAASAGYRVALLARDPARLAAVVDSIGADRALAIAGDVQSWEDQVAAVDAVEDRFGRLDAVFANAGLGGGRDFLDDTPQEWREQLLTNAFGVAACIRAALPALERSRGHVVVCSSVSGRVPVPTVYGASKWAVNGLGHGLRGPLTRRGVRLTLVEPGLIDTPFHEITGIPVAAVAGDIGVDAPLTADDVADCVLFALTRPRHVAVNEILVRPSSQFE